jgi:hypothetical protein
VPATIRNIEAIRAIDQNMSQREGAPEPIMCTLSESDLLDRSAAWQKLLHSGQVERIRVTGGIQLKATPGATKALHELIDLERECCEWIHYDVGPDSTITLTAPGDGEGVLAGMFLAS